MHVKVLPKALKLFALPDSGKTLAEQAVKTGMPVALAVAGMGMVTNQRAFPARVPEHEEKGISALALAMFENNLSHK